MATMITDDCIFCGACIAECPNDAIEAGEPYRINPDRCSECVGFHNVEACQSVCPVECCLPDPSRVETEDELLAKAQRLHPKLQLTATPKTSRFRLLKQSDGGVRCTAPLQADGSSPDVS